MSISKESGIEYFCITLTDYVKMCHSDNRKPVNIQKVEYAYSTSDGDIPPQQDNVNFMSAKEVKPSVEKLL